ncbi:transposase domain-containing protein [Actinomadura montaniterrae]|uniref:transposase domain-containing protein n=1 Tax=Actinomadura montaniterrae TaxID=1803903 RepID=UPI00384B31EB
MYSALALALFPRMGYARGWGKLVAGLAGLPLPVASETALHDLRRRLGSAPLEALFDVVAGPLPQPVTPGVQYRRWRTVAFDAELVSGLPDPAAPSGRRLSRRGSGPCSLVVCSYVAEQRGRCQHGASPVMVVQQKERHKTTRVARRRHGERGRSGVF